MPNPTDTAPFEEVAPDLVPIINPIAKDGDQFPKFRGGSAAFYKIIAMHLQHPALEIENQLAGEVRLSFIIDTVGSVKEVQVVEGINQLYDEACVKCLKNPLKGHLELGYNGFVR